MKIYYLSASRIPSRAANSVHVMKMAAAFAEEGHAVTVFCRKGDEASEGSAYSYYGVNPTFSLQICRWPNIRGVGGHFYAMAVARIAALLGTPDLFYGRHIGSIARVVAKGYRARLEVHAPPVNLWQSWQLKRIFSSKTFDGLVTISESLKQEYLRLFPFLNEKKVLVAHDGADPLSEVQNVELRKVDSGAARSVGYVGHLYPGKGLEIILAMAGQLPEVVFHVIGGTAADVIRWSKLADDRRNIIFHGHVPHGDLDSMMSKFAVALAPYQRIVRVSGSKGDMGRWMSPLKLFEYMAHGKAIVASDLPTIREVIKPEKTGLLCNPDDLAQWIEAVKNLMNDPKRIGVLGRAAQETLKAQYTWQHRSRYVLS